MADEKPKKTFDWWETFSHVCSFPDFITQEDIAATMQVSVDTCVVRIREKFPGMTFSEFRAKMQGALRTRLMGKQFEMALGGNTRMAIWLGKQYLGQKDHFEFTPTGGKSIQLKYALPEKRVEKPVDPIPEKPEEPK